ncbi:MAG TPA: CPBP family intramembrane glutamic endopeptidase [Longimicrobiaceae bacterium]|nr:CPBP family intramembrane glutamic endopeptidase [Longimicrobiaceae bacterium]
MQRYFEITRKHSYSLLFALPLLVLYEAGAALTSGGRSGLRNGADVLLRMLLAAGGVRSTLAFTALLLVAAAVLIARERRREPLPLRGGVFAGMAAESVVYAVLFGFVVGGLTSWMLGGGWLAMQNGSLEKLPLLDGIVLSLGAGFYEELLFRVLMVGGLLYAFTHAGVSQRGARIYAALLAAFLFSAFHYVGPYAYPLELSSFTFRFLAGLAFNVLFILRGFGITAWTHALYDVFLLIVQGGG